jgi:hypothetical protein
LDEDMTDTVETVDTGAVESDAIAQALEIIDSSLRSVCRRELVSSSEVSDLLLDVRSVLAARELTELDGLAESAPASTSAN